MHLLAISGSLRAASSNTALLHAAAQMAPRNIIITVYDRLGEIPPFNPDRDVDPAICEIADFRTRLQTADGVLISSPEYAHGVPGVLKNALDWLVGSGEFMNKPTSVINASPHASLAQLSLTETLRVMMADLIPEASITLPGAGRKLDEAGIAADPEISAALRTGITAFADAISRRRNR